MTKIILNGCNGRMGNVITKAVNNNDDKFQIICGIDKFSCDDKDYPVFLSPNDIPIEISSKADCVIDFSLPQALKGILDFALINRIPVVCATTGLNDDHLNLLKKASKNIPVLFTSNLSIGINLLVEMAKLAAKTFGNEYDIEIIEQHHNKKLDAPSGTALMLANEIKDALDNDPVYIYERQSKREQRSNNEIGIHSIRGGNIIGEHEIMFAGENEIITIKHSARDKGLFADGALKASEFVKKAKPGLYTMKDVLA